MLVLTPARGANSAIVLLTAAGSAVHIVLGLLKKDA
jgi:hypothetical protein